MCHQQDLWEEEYVNKVLVIEIISLHPELLQVKSVSKLETVHDSYPMSCPRRSLHRFVARKTIYVEY